MAQFLAGGSEVTVYYGQSVISSSTIVRGNIKPPKVELKIFSGDLKDFFKFQVNFREYLKIRKRNKNFSV